MLQGKVAVIGITGGIAAYKTAELVSRLVKKGCDVHVIMTEAAQQFITPVTMRTLTGNPVSIGLFDAPSDWKVGHVSLADRADVLAIVPATANIIGKVALGIADDMLSTTVMAATCPVMFAPAMNVHMYQNKFVQDNIHKLKNAGYYFVEPQTGRLACGYEGKGRLADIDKIEQTLIGLLVPKRDFAGKSVLVTAGPTREAVDPVRFFSNHSSGKMGYELARAAEMRGAKVYLISGPTALPNPERVEMVRVNSAQDMYQKVLERYPDVDVVIKAAAVADYRPKIVHQEKMKKNTESLYIELEKNPDILWELGRRKQHQILVGFAAETHNVENYAREKITQKNLDMIVANDVTTEGAGFSVDTNIVTLITANGEVNTLPLLTKQETAHAILDKIWQLPTFSKNQ